MNFFEKYKELDNQELLEKYEELSKAYKTLANYESIVSSESTKTMQLGIMEIEMHYILELLESRGYPKHTIENIRGFSRQK